MIVSFKENWTWMTKKHPLSVSFTIFNTQEQFQANTIVGNLSPLKCRPVDLDLLDLVLTPK